MDKKRQQCLAGNQPIQIIITDDTFNKDMIQWRSLSKCFLPKFGSQHNMDDTKQCRDCFPLMVDPRNVIGAVKAYIQEEKGIAFKKQKLLSEDGQDLSDTQTLLSLGIKKGSTLILQYAPVTQISVKILMLCCIVKDPWSMNRTMQIIIHDDSYKDEIEWCSLSRSFEVKFGRKSFAVKFGPEDTNTIRDGRLSYTLMVEPNDTIAAVKSYIQEQTGFSFKKQELLNEDAVLRDPQTLVSLGIKKASALILRYAPIFSHKCSCIFDFKIQHSDTVGDFKAIFQEKTGVRFHKQRLTCRGQTLANDERLVDIDISSIQLLILS